MNKEQSKIHRWDVTPKEAIEIQKQLALHINTDAYEGEIKYLAGADISLNMFSDIAYAGIIVVSYPDMTPVAHAVVKLKINFPYIPGLLSFREIPALTDAWNILEEKIKNKKSPKPDILVMDGQGIAHPRGMGIATHIGMILDIPTIGVAKSILFGVHKELGEKAGSKVFLYDNHDPTKKIGVVLRTKKKTKPVIVSPGNMISLEQSTAIIEKCSRGYRIPEPTRLAHELVNQFRIGEITD